MKPALIILLPFMHFGVLAFDPPNAETRLKAIGNTENLSQSEQNAFAPDTCFSPIPAPGPSDWLNKFDEKGQTYDQFLKEGYPKPARGKDTIYILPIGSFNEKAPDLKLLKTYIQTFFSMRVVLLETVDETGLNFTSRLNRDGKTVQYLTEDIIKYLAGRKPENAYLILGITMTDLYPHETWNFAFGQADQSKRAGVLSFARFHPDILVRSIKVLSHETGHLFGLAHCIYYSCLMNGFNHMEEADRTPLHLCPVCLRKLHSLTGFDPGARYRFLHMFYKKNGLRDGAGFTLDRIRIKIARPASRTAR